MPRHLLEVTISPAIIKAYGFDPETPQSDLLLAQVLLQAARYGGKWRVNASGLTETPGELEEVGSMWCDDGTQRDEVLSIADSWVRESEGATFVPGPAFELPIEDAKYAQFAVNGLILVRGLL